MLDLRFPTALQAMLSLALAQREGVSSLTSKQLADGIGVNPSFVRNLLVPLVQKGLVVASEGKNGGARLGRPAKAITLKEIYGAVTGDKGIWIPRLDVPHQCLVSSNVTSFFERLAAEATASVLSLLATRTLYDSLVEIEKTDQRSKPSRQKEMREAATHRNAGSK